MENKMINREKVNVKIEIHKIKELILCKYLKLNNIRIFNNEILFGIFNLNDLKKIKPYLTIERYEELKNKPNDIYMMGFNTLFDFENDIFISKNKLHKYSILEPNEIEDVVGFDEKEEVFISFDALNTRGVGTNIIISTLNANIVDDFNVNNIYNFYVDNLLIDIDSIINFKFYIYKNIVTTRSNDLVDEKGLYENEKILILTNIVEDITKLQIMIIGERKMLITCRSLQSENFLKFEKHVPEDKIIRTNINNVDNIYSYIIEDVDFDDLFDKKGNVFYSKNSNIEYTLLTPIQRDFLIKRKIEQKYQRNIEPYIVTGGIKDNRKIFKDTWLNYEYEHSDITNIFDNESVIYIYDIIEGKTKMISLYKNGKHIKDIVYRCFFSNLKNGVYYIHERLKN